MAPRKAINFRTTRDLCANMLTHTRVAARARAQAPVGGSPNHKPFRHHKIQPIREQDGPFGSGTSPTKRRDPRFSPRQNLRSRRTPLPRTGKPHSDPGPRTGEPPRRRLANRPLVQVVLQLPTFENVRTATDSPFPLTPVSIHSPAGLALSW